MASDNEAVNYPAVLGGIEELCERNLGARGSERNRSLVETYWQIGRRIAAADGLDAGQRSRRGSLVIKRLAADLGEKYGEGFSASNLFSMRKFGLAYDLPELADPLSWTQYRLLVGIENAAERRKLESRVRSGELNYRELAVAASALVAAGSRDQPREAGRSPLTVRSGQLELYRLERDAGAVVLDGGFGVKLPWDRAVAHELANRCLVRIGPDGLAAATVAHDGERFCYRARIGRVIDGDTLLLRVDLGFGLGLDQRFRLRGADASELGSAEGSSLKTWLEGIAWSGRPVLLFTYGTDVYGRYVADVLVSDASNAGLTPGADGLIFLNELLLDSGLVGYKTRTTW